MISFSHEALIGLAGVMAGFGLASAIIALVGYRADRPRRPSPKFTELKRRLQVAGAKLCEPI